MSGVVFRWVMQMHIDVPKAAKFYSEGLGFTVNVCTPSWAELSADTFKLALLHTASEPVVQKGYSSLLSFTVTDINSTVMKLMELGAELDGPIKHETHGKEFDLEIRDRKGVENQVADHLSRLEKHGEEIKQIKESFPDDQLFRVKQMTRPWFAAFANYAAAGVIPKGLNWNQRRKLLSDAKRSFWEEPYLFKRCTDQIIRRFLPDT